MSIYRQTLEESLENKRLRLEGKHIAIPFPYPRFAEHFPGIMKRRYFIVTANSKVGKSKITDFLFVTSPFEFSRSTPTNIKPRIKYFSLEMSKYDKIKEMRSYLLFKKYGITMPPDEVDSVYHNRILNDDIERIIKSDEFMLWFEDFESTVEYIDYTKNPYGIYKNVREYAHKNGVYVDGDGKQMDMSIPQRYDDPRFRETPEQKIEVDRFNKAINGYKPTDPDEFLIIVVDHARLLTVERGYDDRGNIENFSSKYLMPMRDRWSYIPVMVQQQAASQESVENQKADRLRPSPDGLGISKNTQQDCDVLLGLFSPARHRKLTWEGYDISKLQDRFREFDVLLNRRGNSLRTCLYFNGASNFFKELPKSNQMTDELYKKINDHTINPQSI